MGWNGGNAEMNSMITFFLFLNDEELSNKDMTTVSKKEQEKGASSKSFCFAIIR